MMPEEDLKRTLGFYIPTVLLILVPVVLIAFLVRTQRGEVRNVTGSNLETAARTAAIRVDQYLAHLEADVRTLSASPYIAAQAEAALAIAPNPFQIARVDSAWQADGAPPPPPLLRSNPLESELSLYLRTVVRDLGTYHELIVADVHGRLVAASGETDDYDQAGEPWFDGALEDCPQETDCAHLLDIALDESTAATGFEISTPIRVNGRTVGVLKAVVDPTSVVSVLDAVESTGFAEAFLLHSDGNVIVSGTKRRIVGEERFFGSDSVRNRASTDAAAVLRPHEFQFVAEHQDGTARLVGASTGRIRSGNLTWVVAVVEPETLIRGFVGAQIWYIAAFAGLLAFLLSNLSVRRTRALIAATGGDGANARTDPPGAS